jgi:hypothetical protein
MAVSMEMTVFWDVALCSIVDVLRRFRGAYCLHYHGALMKEGQQEPVKRRQTSTRLHDAIFLKTVTFTVKLNTNRPEHFILTENYGTSALQKMQKASDMTNCEDWMTAAVLLSPRANTCYRAKWCPKAFRCDSVPGLPSRPRTQGRMATPLFVRNIHDKGKLSSCRICNTDISAVCTSR